MRSNVNNRRNNPQLSNDPGFFRTAHSYQQPAPSRQPMQPGMAPNMQPINDDEWGETGEMPQIFRKKG